LAVLLAGCGQPADPDLEHMGYSSAFGAHDYSDRSHERPEHYRNCADEFGYYCSTFGGPRGVSIGPVIDGGCLIDNARPAHEICEPELRAAGEAEALCREIGYLPSNPEGYWLCVSGRALVNAESARTIRDRMEAESTTPTSQREAGER
jgi:hypothetical protein